MSSFNLFYKITQNHGVLQFKMVLEFYLANLHVNLKSCFSFRREKKTGTSDNILFLKILHIALTFDQSKIIFKFPEQTMASASAVVFPTSGWTFRTCLTLNSIPKTLHAKSIGEMATRFLPTIFFAHSKLPYCNLL